MDWDLTATLAKAQHQHLVLAQSSRTELLVEAVLGGCQKCGPFLGTLNIRYRILIGIQKGDHNFDNHP